MFKVIVQSVIVIVIVQKSFQDWLQCQGCDVGLRQETGENMNQTVPIVGSVCTITTNSWFSITTNRVQIVGSVSQPIGCR